MSNMNGLSPVDIVKHLAEYVDGEYHEISSGVPMVLKDDADGVTVSVVYFATTGTYRIYTPYLVPDREQTKIVVGTRDHVKRYFEDEAYRKKLLVLFHVYRG